MSSARSLTRLAFRPLSTRYQCRHASEGPRPATVRESATGGLVNDIFGGANRQRRSPFNTADTVGGKQDIAAVNRAPGNTRPPAKFMRMAEDSAKAREQEQLQAMKQPFTRVELERQMTRRFAIGDVYAPHDLTGVQMGKWKKPWIAKTGKRDVFDQLGINPMREYKNFAMMAEFVTETGRIKHRRDTGLRPVNQRRLARAIRRAVGVGLMPRTYRHPELLKKEERARKR